MLLDDHRGLAAHRDEPVGELLGVAHGGRQRDEAHRFWEMDDHLFPDPATHPVSEVVHLVHDHVSQTGQRRRRGVQHVAQYLGGHDDDRRFAVDRVVPRQQADLFRSVATYQVGVLLVRQRLDRRRVEALAALGQCEVDGELANDRLAGAGRCGHQNAVAVFQCATGADLEVVKREVVQGPEGVAGQPALRVASPLCGRVALRGTRLGGHDLHATRSSTS